MKNLTEDITNFVKELLLENSKKQQPHGPNWEQNFKFEIENLVKKYENEISEHNRASVFTIGDDNLYSCNLKENEEINILQKKNLTTKIPYKPSLNGFNKEKIFNSTQKFDDEEKIILAKLRSGKMRHRELEKSLDEDKSVKIRRRYIEEESGKNLANLSYKDYDYKLVNGACCENIIGYMQIPVGVAGPLFINIDENEDYFNNDSDEEDVPFMGNHSNKVDKTEISYIPMATTEGALIASTNRGCKAINESGGVQAILIKDAMSRAPVVEFETAKEATKCMKWIQKDNTFRKLKEMFESTSSYAQLKNVECHISGNLLHVRFEASTGDAMGMNMVSKGVTLAINLLKKKFPRANVCSISGNTCADKKASAINVIKGRGKTVIAEAKITKKVVETILKTTVEDMVKLGAVKLNNGALNALSIGGANAHSANVVAAIFLATGQDAAQVVSSHMCTTMLSKDKDGSLRISCTMDCLEVGTVGGGTILAPQQTCLDMLSCKGPSKTTPGKNSQRLAKIISCVVLAGELSLLASQCTNDLVQTHMRLNRSSRDLFSRCYAPEITQSPLASLSISSANLTISNTNNEYFNNSLLKSSISTRELVNRPSLLINNNTTAPTILDEELKLRNSSTVSSATKVAKKALNKCDQSFI